MSSLLKLSELIPSFQSRGINLSLSRIEGTIHRMGNPCKTIPAIQVIGTNGKGSIQSFIKSILVSNGYTCDAYISPHLTKFNERIVLNNKEVSTKKLYQTLQFVKKINNNNPITFFEITTAAAFVLFQRSRSNFLILETGFCGLGEVRLLFFHLYGCK